MITAALTLAYLVWVNIIAFYGGFWVYPVFKVTLHCDREKQTGIILMKKVDLMLPQVLSAVQRALFMAACSVGGGAPTYFPFHFLFDLQKILVYVL